MEGVGNERDHDIGLLESLVKSSGIVDIKGDSLGVLEATGESLGALEGTAGLNRMVSGLSEHIVYPIDTYRQ